jgi:hypothetical protein
MTHRIHRRTLAASLALGAPLLALHERSGLAQTPMAATASDALGLIAQITALDPADLLEALLSTEIGHTQFELFTELEVTAWTVEQVEEFGGEALGAVVIHKADAETSEPEAVIGDLIVFEPDESAASFMRQLETEMGKAPARYRSRSPVSVACRS